MEQNGPPMKDDAYGSARKALRILELLAARSPRGVMEIAAELAMPKGSVSRLLKALARWGYVVQNLRRGQYHLGPKVVALSDRYSQSDRLLKTAQPIMRELALAARATAHLGVIIEGELLVVAKEPSPERIQVDSRVGGRIPPHASAMGKVLLAGLPAKERLSFLKGPLPRFTEKTIVDRRQLLKVLEEVRKTGIALEAGEDDPGAGCIGAPVIDDRGRWIAALSISGPITGTPFRLDAAHRRCVLEAAARLSRAISIPEA
jgi:DNA-binding IclR family transcriptional regulator